MNGRHHINKFDIAKSRYRVDKDIITLLKYGWTTSNISTYLGVTKNRVESLRKKHKYYRRNDYELS